MTQTLEQTTSPPTAAAPLGRPDIKSLEYDECNCIPQDAMPGQNGGWPARPVQPNQGGGLI